MSGLTLIVTYWHIDGIHKIVFQEKLSLKNISRRQKIMEYYPICKELRNIIKKVLLRILENYAPIQQRVIWGH